MATDPDDVRFQRKTRRIRPTAKMTPASLFRRSDPRSLSRGGEQLSRALDPIRLAIMLTYHFSNTGGALATLNFDHDFVGDAQRIGWHVLRRYHFNAAT